MGSMRDIKRRIKSIRNTQQITKAMNLVATSKLQKLKNKLISTRPFKNEIKTMVNNVIENSLDLDNIYIKRKDSKKTLVVVFTSNRGLCGSYNINILKKSFEEIKNKENVILIVIGSKGVEYFSEKNIKIKKYFKNLLENICYEDAKEISDEIRKLYESKEVDEVFLAYTKFESNISYIPTIEKILPISNNKKEKNKRSKKDTILYEPCKEIVFENIIELYINSIVFGALLESVTCEQGSRMTSMDSATKNAEEAIDSMTIMYNRARQGAITQEITEIVSGANALR